MNLFGWNSFQSFPLVNGTKSVKFFPVSFPVDHTNHLWGHFEECMSSSKEYCISYTKYSWFQLVYTYNSYMLMVQSLAQVYRQ